MSETVADFVLGRLRAWGVEKVFAYPGDGINGHAGRLGSGRQRAEVRASPPRGDGSVRGGRLRQILRAGRGVRGDVGSGSGASAERALRRQVGSCAGGGHRGPDGAVGHGRLVPAGNRPGDAVQGLLSPLRGDGHGSPAIPEPDRPGLPGRHGHPQSDLHHRPLRRPGARVCAPGARVQDGPVERGHRLADAGRRRWGDRQSGGDLERRREGRDLGRPRGAGCPGRGPRGRRPARCGGGQSAARQRRPVGRPSVRDRLHRPAGYPAQLRDDDGLRHRPHRWVELPLHPVHAQVRPGPRHPDRPRRQLHRHALSLRAEHRRRRRPPRSRHSSPSWSAKRTGRGGRRSRRTCPIGGTPCNAKP